MSYCLNARNIRVLNSNFYFFLSLHFDRKSHSISITEELVDKLLQISIIFLLLLALGKGCASSGNRKTTADWPRARISHVYVTFQETITIENRSLNCCVRGSRGDRSYLWHGTPLRPCSGVLHSHSHKRDWEAGTKTERDIVGGTCLFAYYYLLSQLIILLSCLWMRLSMRTSLNYLVNRL